MRRAVSLAALALALCASTPARAQIVNVQSALAEVPPEGFSGGIDASIDWRTGNSKLLRLAGAATLRFRRGDGVALLVAKGEYGRAGKPAQTFLAKTFGHLRYRHTLACWLQAEAFLQHETDEFRRLAVRALAGAGPRFVLLQRPRGALALGVAYLLEHSRLREDGLPEAGESSLEHRLSGYVVGSLVANPRVSFQGSLYLQPRIDVPEDLHLLGELGLVAGISERLAITVQLALAYDGRPPPGIEDVDSSLLTGVSVKL